MFTQGATFRHNQQPFFSCGSPIVFACLLVFIIDSDSDVVHAETNTSSGDTVTHPATARVVQNHAIYRASSAETRVNFEGSCSRRPQILVLVRTRG